MTLSVACWFTVSAMLSCSTAPKPGAWTSILYVAGRQRPEAIRPAAVAHAVVYDIGRDIGKRDMGIRDDCSRGVADRAAQAGFIHGLRARRRDT